MNIKRKFLNNISQIPGWHTNRKIVVIESDDWGSIRMPSADTIELLKSKEIQIDDPYNLNDSLASEQDLSCLFEVLTSFKDSKGNHPVITANTIMANPDFKKIKTSNFKEFHFEHFTETLQKYSKHQQSFTLWKQGMQAKVFRPQYHGREHVNIFKWLHVLRDENSVARKAFDYEIFGLREADNSSLRAGFMRALDFETETQAQVLQENLLEGLTIFKETFGYTSQSFIAPSYVWNEKVEQLLAHQGVKYLQGISYQYEPILGKQSLQKKWHFTGQKNKFGQTYLIRNTFFEPSLIQKSSIEEVLKRINIAFRWNKPAIIGSHRINYVGFINSENRDKNLVLLTKLLKSILKRWPDVEFMSSDHLGETINSKL